ncbi:ubiquitin carboxyl-terminal hydrolase 17-like protein 6 [Hyaena hyaena]|uniref:ubiquitin carboxyl-terminal hydrolase 17-like protein 6 n=1 Tax=Hyaena hyaena TaxID=95912 RepID=UPI00192360EB|nr:ubiquitin carboxyl-terminal hydrolase 17-like protein 6 [Hyaena hyaena]
MPSASSQTRCNLPNGWAPASTRLAPYGDTGSWRGPPGIGAGLQNVGNTCYVNAALQCLTYTPPLASSMLSQEHSRSCGKHTFCVHCARQAHVTRALGRPADVIRPPPTLLTAFHTHRQEDAHEFLLFTLDAMQQAWTQEDKPSGPQADDSSLIRQIFGGYWRSQIQCLRCQGVSSTLDPYLDISLDIRAAESVSQALQQLVQPERLDGENAYRCRTCLDKVPASKTLTLHTCSKVLMLVLKRFSHFTGNKLAQEVQYPECLDMQQYMSEPKAGSRIYVLYAVLVHAGWNCQRGHYFCYVRAGNGQWYKMDDAKVTASDVTSALSQQAYVLFYIQKSELERDRVWGPGGGESTSPQAGHAHRRGVQGGPETDPNIKDPELEDRGEDTPGQPITLEEWRLLQESRRPRSEFNLRKIESALPAHAVLIHQSKYREEGGKEPREQNIYPLNNSSRDNPPHGATDIDKVPCLI